MAIPWKKKSGGRRKQIEFDRSDRAPILDSDLPSFFSSPSPFPLSLIIIVSLLTYFSNLTLSLSNLSLLSTLQLKTGDSKKQQGESLIRLG